MERDSFSEPEVVSTLLLEAILSARSRRPNLHRLFSLAADVLYAVLVLFLLIMIPWRTPS